MYLDDNVYLDAYGQIELTKKNLYLQFWKANPDQEVGSPVAETSNGHGGWAGSLGEELGHNEPWDWTGPQLEECHKCKHRPNAQVTQ